MTHREKRLRKAERLREWSDKRRARSAAAFKTADTIASAIPFGQPILVGHHSERHHRRDLDRIDRNMRAGFEHHEKAGEMTSRAANIEHAADAAIYRDDPDAIERLQDKIASLEAERERRKTASKAIRKHGLERLLQPDPPFELTDAEKRDLLSLMRHTPYHEVETKGWPSYANANVTGTINRERKRLAELIAAKTPQGDAVKAPEGATATDRAGLTVTATMTTPRRPGKAPRPVWVVAGNLAYWRPLLIDRLGGSPYAGTISFWEDPAADIEAACLEAEGGANA